MKRNKSIEETINDLAENLKAEKLGVLWEFDIKETLR